MRRGGCRNDSVSIPCDSVGWRVVSDGTASEKGYGMKSQVKTSRKPEMNLRDYFAGQAIIGMVDSENLEKKLRSYRDSKEVDKNLAERAYEIADAMIEARKRR
jgi:hypothetical protein